MYAIRGILRWSDVEFRVFGKILSCVGKAAVALIRDIKMRKHMRQSLIQ